MASLREYILYFCYLNNRKRNVTSLLKKVLFLFFYFFLFVLYGCGTLVESLTFDLQQNNSLKFACEFVNAPESDYGLSNEEVEQFFDFLRRGASMSGAKVNFRLTSSDITSDEIWNHYRIRLSFTNRYQVEDFVNYIKKEDSRLDYFNDSFDFTLDPVKEFRDKRVWRMSLNLSLNSEEIIYLAVKDGEFGPGKLEVSMPGELKNWEPKDETGNYRSIIEDKNTIVFMVDEDLELDDHDSPVSFSFTSIEKTFDNDTYRRTIIKNDREDITNNNPVEIDNSVNTAIVNNFNTDTATKAVGGLGGEINNDRNKSLSMREIVLLITAFLGLLTALITFLQKRKNKEG